MKIEITTLNAEVVERNQVPYVQLRFGNALVKEWLVPEEDREKVVPAGWYGGPTDEDIKEYVEMFVAGKLGGLLGE